MNPLLYILITAGTLIFGSMLVTAIFPKKKEESKPKQKEYQLVKGEIKNLELKTYSIKIYDEAGELLEECSASDSVSYSRSDFYPCGPENASYAHVNSTDMLRFKNFLEFKTLSFENFDEHTVSLSTDIIKKIVIEVFDSWEENVQLYKLVEKQN